MNILNRKTPFGLLCNIVVAILIACLGNLIVILLNPTEMMITHPVPLNPPGYVVGIVWVFLFGCMGAARWIMVSRETPDWRSARRILWLELLCVAYPLYTAGLHSLWLGLAGNIVTICAAVWVIYRGAPTSTLAAGLLSLIICWVCFASILVLEQMNFLRLI